MHRTKTSRARVKEAKRAQHALSQHLAKRRRPRRNQDTGHRFTSNKGVQGQEGNLPISSIDYEVAAKSTVFGGETMLMSTEEAEVRFQAGNHPG